MALELRVDGRRVFAATGGKAFDPALPAVVFVHGAAMNRTVWAAQARYFAHRGRCVLACDLPGHGRSEGPPLASIAAIADWLARLMDSAGLESAALVGHSMGTLPVLEAAARHGRRVERAVLLGTALPMAVAGPLLDNARADSPAAWDMVTFWGHGRAAQLGGNTAPGIWMTGAARRLLERGGPGVLYNDMKACNDYRDGLAAAAAVACPVTLVLGEADAMTPPKSARTLLDALPDGRLVVLKGCGHMMMAERPNETLDALVEAMATPAKRGSRHGESTPVKRGSRHERVDSREAWQSP